MTTNDVNREWIFEIFDRWATLLLIEQLDDQKETREQWLHYVGVLQKKVADDWELSMIIKDIKRINEYLNYDYIQDFHSSITCLDGDVVLDKSRFAKEKKIYENWDNISAKHEKRSEKALNMKVSFIGEIIKEGLDAIHSKREEKYKHFKSSQEKMTMRSNYMKNQQEILIPLMEERDVKLSRYMDEVIKLIAEEQPTLFCKKIKKSTYNSDVEYEEIFRDAFNNFRSQLIQEYKNTKIFCKPQSNSSITT